MLDWVVRRPQLWGLHSGCPSCRPTRVSSGQEWSLVC